ncbi:ABC transporter substrate-binding protein [Paenibacillus alvei]|uniref:ABC transporter substrate-binding protein n=1 Tax=Paenibacillus alvei TaxID=44250 RepID=A0ABT4H1L9_PAEAL|nr:ABC transporter substrate-binding protein [Paenibacillus alvei]EJW15047.1 oligopeptide-binding protein AppA [Paenibacillus alvei DSM 29]MCY9541088.1 ABC transporter substrate-binding protein [Paenibacillus alvei]MCY9703749.1 ABC transporter substrate-binding protein [Paenibacillus alvei]MCY9734555.1 ABC transporter substrate-binding protein [Paenibacillus alvei]MCY9757292.1 ABC transporter substrate-binding protein [Paenibacillus alvei]
MKRNKLWIIGLLTLIVLVVSACGNNTTPAKDSTATTAEGSGQPKDGGNIIIAVHEDPRVLNPMYSNDRVTLTINQTLYAPLYTVEDGGKKKFVLAESMTPSKDFLTYTLKLRKGLTWHDGKPLTADDVVFTMNSILDEKQHSTDRESYIFNGKPLQAKKVDDLTVDFVLPQPTASFEGIFASFKPIPKHIFEGEADIEKSSKNANPIGSGAYKFKEYRPGEYVTLDRYDNYFAGKGHLDQIIYRIAKDPNAANLALQNGELNMRKVDPADYNKLNASGKLNMVVYPEGRLNYLVFNMNVDAMQKKEVRQAISYAINKEELIQLAYGSAEFADPASSIFTPDTTYYTADVEKYDYSAEKAKELLQKAGVSNLKLKLAYSNAVKIQTSQALYIQQKLKEVGIEVELMPLESGTFSNMALDPDNTKFDLSFNGYVMGTEPDSYKSLYLSNQLYNYGHYNNPELDKLWEQAAVEMDGTKRGELYKQIQQTIANEAVIYPIANDKAIIAVDKRYGGLEEAVAKPVFMFEDLSKIYMK